MPDFGLKVRNMPQVLESLNRLKDGAGQLGRMKDSIVSDVPYAAGQNYGKYRDGRNARAGGIGTHFFEAGRDAIEQSAVDQLGPAVRKGSGAVKQAWSVVVKRGVETSRRTAPVKTGALRDSIHAAGGGRA
jgi:hypothetical protein